MRIFLKIHCNYGWISSLSHLCITRQGKEGTRKAYSVEHMLGRNPLLIPLFDRYCWIFVQVMEESEKYAFQLRDCAWWWNVLHVPNHDYTIIKTNYFDLIVFVFLFSSCWVLNLLVIVSSSQWRHKSVIVSQITSVLTLCPGLQQRKHQSSALLALCEGNHWWLSVPLTKGQ